MDYDGNYRYKPASASATAAAGMPQLFFTSNPYMFSGAAAGHAPPPSLMPGLHLYPSPQPPAPQHQQQVAVALPQTPAHTTAYTAPAQSTTVQVAMGHHGPPTSQQATPGLDLNETRGGMPLSYSPPPATARELRIVAWEELQRLLPPGRNQERPESGQLPDGKYYTPKTPRRDHYFLFASKGEYIAHFVHYYFSKANMQRDRTLQELLINGGTTLPVDKLLFFPRLSQVETSEEDLIEALRDSTKLFVVDVGGQRGVRRVDAWSPLPTPVNSGPSSIWLETASVNSSGSVTSGPSPISGGVPPPPPAAATYYTQNQPAPAFAPPGASTFLYATPGGPPPSGSGYPGQAPPGTPTSGYFSLPSADAAHPPHMQHHHAASLQAYHPGFHPSLAAATTTGLMAPGGPPTASPWDPAVLQYTSLAAAAPQHTFYWSHPTYPKQ